MVIWTAIKSLKAKYDYVPWEEFEQTVFTTTEGKPWHCHYALDTLPLFVITACCPYSIDIDHQFNCELHGLLQWHVRSAFPSASLEEIVGCSADGQWQELSWAVTGINEDQALEVGRVFHQWAIFKLNGKERQVLRC
jgi:hypothetical protein